MKKFILPLVAILFLSVAATAQTSTKPSTAKAIISVPAKTTTAKTTTAKNVSSADTTKPKSKTMMPANTKKKHHKKKAATKTIK